MATWVWPCPWGIIGRELMSQVDGSFGALLRTHRGTVSLTQEELAARAGLSVDAISLLERGGRRAPRASTVDCLATALKLDPAQRSAFVAAATGLSEPAANGGKIGSTTVQLDPTSTQRRQPPTVGFGQRFRVAILTLALLPVMLLGVGLARDQIPLSSLHGTSVSPPKPLVTGLSVSPASLTVADGSYTTISFHLNVAATVTLTIRDSEGTQQRTLLNNVPKPAGTVSRQYFGWNGSAPLRSGGYLVEVAASARGTTFTVRTPLTLM
jgi:transcriptional regulator with XRE-family HTH domain